jgi:hypothetical protein
MDRGKVARKQSFTHLPPPLGSQEAENFFTVMGEPVKRDGGNGLHVSRSFSDEVQAW